MVKQEKPAPGTGRDMAADDEAVLTLDRNQAQQPEDIKIQAPDETAQETAEQASPQDARYNELYEQYLRLAADFDNYRKRHSQEQEALRKYGAEHTVRSLLPVLDNLERATASLSEQSDPKILYQSFRLMYQQLLDALQTLGIQRMQTVGEPFDPNFHEAVSQVESLEHPDNTVVGELQPGFLLHDRVLRPAMVSVSVGGTSQDDDNPFIPPESGNFTPEE